MKDVEEMKDVGFLKFFVDFVLENIFMVLLDGKLML